MTTNNRSWRRAGAFATIATVSALGVGLAAGTAQAHTPVWEVSCTEVGVDLTAYSPKEDNTVTVTVDGKDLLPTETFKGNFHKKLELPKHDKELTVRLVVKAGDDDKFSRDETKTAPVCDDKPSPTPTPSQTTPAPSETPSDTPSTATSSAEVPPASTKPSPAGDLAETGSSSSTPLIAGAAAVVIVAGGGIMWAARKRRSAQH